MDEKKQIEEIDSLTTVLYEANHKKSVLDYHWLATEAYNAGYRKQSEGEWIFNKGRTYGEPAYYCSNCSEGASDYGYDKFCPNCGAKMKGV